MKKLLHLWVGIMVSISTQAQLQNLDFEQWDEPVTDLFHQNRPTGWIWTNSQMDWVEYFFYYPPSNDAKSGNHSLYLSVWYNHTKDAAVQHTSIDSRPKTLNGFYKYKHNYIIGPEGWQKDTARISVVLTRFNPITQTIDTIAEGLAEFGEERVNGFAPFSIPLYYTSTLVPDSIIILLDPSLCGRNPERRYEIIGDSLSGHTSFFTIDNLWLSDEFNGLESANSLSTFSVFPNPAIDFIQIDQSTNEVWIRDITGRVIDRVQPISGRVGVQQLKPGTYLMEIVENNQRSRAKFIKL